MNLGALARSGFQDACSLNTYRCQDITHTSRLPRETLVITKLEMSCNLKFSL